MQGKNDSNHGFRQNVKIRLFRSYNNMKQVFNLKKNSRAHSLERVLSDFYIEANISRRGAVIKFAPLGHLFLFVFSVIWGFRFWHRSEFESSAHTVHEEGVLEKLQPQLFIKTRVLSFFCTSKHQR